MASHDMREDGDMASRAKDVACIEVPVEECREQEGGDAEAEEFAYKIIRRAVTLTGVKIDRASFFRTELKRHSPHIDAERAIATTPIAAGATTEEIDRAARAVIDFETKKCAAISFAAGIPGGLALAGTVPADLAQYFAHVMRVEQKLAYLYGWQSFLDEDDEIDEQTIMELVILMGVMLGVGGVTSQIAKFAGEAAQRSVAKAIQRQALTKTAWYPLMKKVLGFIGVKVTKDAFAKTASKVVPVLGGVVSGGLTYASFKPSAERLRRHLRTLPMSGIDASVEDAGRDDATEALMRATDGIEGAATAAADKAKDIGEIVAVGAKAAGTAVAGAAQTAGSAALGGAKTAGATVADAAKSAGDFLGALRKKKE